MEKLANEYKPCNSQGCHMKWQVTDLMLGDYDLLNLGGEQRNCIFNNSPTQQQLILIQPVFEEFYQERNIIWFMLQKDHSGNGLEYEFEERGTEVEETFLSGHYIATYLGWEKDAQKG